MLFKKPTAARYTFLHVWIYSKLISKLNETQQTPVRSTKAPRTTQKLFYIHRMEEEPFSETENCGKVKFGPHLLPQLREPALSNWDLHKKGRCTLSTTLTLFPIGKHHLYQYKTDFSAPLMPCKPKRNLISVTQLQTYLFCHYNSLPIFSDIQSSEVQYIRAKSYLLNSML